MSQPTSKVNNAHFGVQNGLSRGIRLTCLTLAFSILAACVSSGLSSGETIVERSKEQPPPWVEQKPGKFLEANDVLTYVTFRSKLSDLPVGIRETQTHAIADSGDALQAYTRDRVLDMADTSAEKAAASSSNFDQESQGVIKEFHAKHARVGDIYFEEITKSGDDSKVETYYRTFVLVQFPRDQFSKLVQALSAKLKKSNQGDMRNLGDAIGKRNPAKNASH